MEQLQCVVQNYAWGKHGRESRVAQLMEGGDAGFSVDESDTYAELWMGTHPSGPAKIVRENQNAELLGEWLKSHAAAAGPMAANGELPFLFKVLSVEKALSIQAHPDLALARSLHARFPDLYKDPNHKPEMAIALTRFEALCQFRPIDEIAAHIQNVPELRAIAGEEASRLLVERRDETALRAFFRSFIQAKHDAIATQIASIRSRLTVLASTGALSPVEALVLRVIGQYGDDIGCFCPYLLNYITLQPGEAVFLGANEPHAYLSGDCIECMACSDNVVRAGLTPKFIDKDTLYEMLTYRTATPAILTGDRVDHATRVYSAPVPEFQVEALSVAAAASSAQPLALTKRTGASVLLVTGGVGVAHHVQEDRTFELRQGRVYLIGAGQDVTIRASGTTAVPVTAFRAFPNEGFGSTTSTTCTSSPKL